MLRTSSTRAPCLPAIVLFSALSLRCGSGDDGALHGDGGASSGAAAGTTGAGGAASASGGSNTASNGGSKTQGSGGSASSGAANGAGGATDGSATDGGDSGGATSTGGATGGAHSGGRSSTGGTNAGGASSGGTSNGGSAGTGGLPGWKLVWSDEFDGANGAAVDSSKWSLVNKGDGFGNNELEFYTNRTDNAAKDGSGFLVITAKKESYMGRDYTSARLESAGKFDHAYGRFESRIKIPKGQGIWPAFWLLGNDIGTAGWPTCGEIDIMENIGKEPSIVHGSMHGPGYSGGNPLGAAYTLPNGGKFADDFHVFAIEWETNVVRFYVDDHLYETRTPADVPSGKKWVYDHPFYVILNVAVGGQWPGSPDGTTQFPQTMTVDYVRVYSR